MEVKGIFLADQVVHGTFLYVEGKWEKVKRQQRALPQCTEIIMEEGEAVVRQPWKCSLLFIPPQRQLACYVQGKHNNNWFFKFPRIKTKPGCRFPEWRSDTKSCDMTSPDVFRSWLSSFSVCQWQRWANNSVFEYYSNSWGWILVFVFGWFFQAE